MWPSWSTVARAVNGEGHYAGQGDNAGSSTAGGWMAKLSEAGWIVTEQRLLHGPGGRFAGTSNMTRIVIPEQYDIPLREAADAARSRSLAGRRNGRRRETAKGGAGSSAVIDAAERQRRQRDAEAATADNGPALGTLERKALMAEQCRRGQLGLPALNEAERAALLAAVPEGIPPP